MNTRDTDMQPIKINNTKLINKGFAILEEKLEKGWELIKNFNTHIIYKKIVTL